MIKYYWQNYKEITIRKHAFFKYYIKIKLNKTNNTILLKLNNTITVFLLFKNNKQHYITI